MVNDGISTAVEDSRGIKTFPVRDHMVNEGTSVDDPSRVGIGLGKIRTFDKPDHILNNVEYTTVKADGTIAPAVVRTHPVATAYPPAETPESQWAEFAESLGGGRPAKGSLADVESRDHLQGDLRSIPNTRGKGFGPRHIEAPSHMAYQGTSNASAQPSGGRRYIGVRDDLKSTLHIDG
jgi:hypothetical protein